MRKTLALKSRSKILCNTTFKQAHRDKQGNLILKKQLSKIYGSMILGVLSCLFLLFVDQYVERFLNEGTILIPLGLIVYFILMTVLVSREKVIVSSKGFTCYYRLGKKHMDFIEVNSIDYKLISEKIVIKSNTEQLSMPIDFIGFEEFYKILIKKTNGKSCKQLETFLNNMKMI